MKLKVIKEFVFLLILLLALPYVSSVELGQCEIVPREECNDVNPESYIVMGLSSETNSHGQIYSQTTYDYVLCCRFGEGGNNCIPENRNKILGLSSITNAHAENPELTNYVNPVCYENIRCKMKSSCITGENGVLSLSAETNAHIGPYTGTGSYANKICCTQESMHYELPCVIKTAQWGTEDGTQDSFGVFGKSVQLKVTGEGGCDGRNVYIEIVENAIFFVNKRYITLSFDGQTAETTWELTEEEGVNQGDSYYFKADLITPVGDDFVQSANLEVLESNFCDDIDTCNDYKNEAKCNSRTIIEEQKVDLCGIAPSINPEGQTTGRECSADASCNCVWFEDACYFNQEVEGLSGWCGDGALSMPNAAGIDEQCDPDAGIHVFYEDLDSCAELTTELITYKDSEEEFKCRRDCSIDILGSKCESVEEPICGDNLINKEGEVCDGEDLGGKSCNSLGGTGTLACNSECQLDSSGCTFLGEFCGDGVVSLNDGNFEEQCDPNNGPGRTGEAVFKTEKDTCDEIVSGSSGTLACNSACLLVTTGCSWEKECGNGVVDTISEQCDGDDLQGLTCQYLGATAGTLACDEDCQIDNLQSCSGVDAGENPSYIYKTEVTMTCDEGLGKQTILFSKIDKITKEIVESYDRTYPCPSYVQLSFFDFVNMIIAMVVIAGIYVVILFKKNKK